MRLPIFILLLGAALVGTAVALKIGTSTTRRASVEFATALSAGTAALWILVTISAFHVVSLDGGTEITHSYPGLGVLGVVGVAISVAVVVKGSIELLGT